MKLIQSKWGSKGPACYTLPKGSIIDVLPKIDDSSILNLTTNKLFKQLWKIGRKIMIKPYHITMRACTGYEEIQKISTQCGKCF